MNLLGEIKAAFEESDLKRLIIRINEVGDLLECSNLSKDDAINSVNFLLNCIEKYRDASVIENILNVCLNIMNAHQVFSGFDLDSLIPYINELSNESIGYLLTFMGFTGDKKYIGEIERFLSRDALKEDAKEALMEINYRARDKN